MTCAAVIPALIAIAPLYATMPATITASTGPMTFMLSATNLQTAPNFSKPMTARFVTIVIPVEIAFRADTNSSLLIAFEMTACSAWKLYTAVFFTLFIASENVIGILSNCASTSAPAPMMAFFTTSAVILFCSANFLTSPVVTPISLAIICTMAGVFDMTMCKSLPRKTPMDIACVKLYMVDDIPSADVPDSLNCLFKISMKRVVSGRLRNVSGACADSLEIESAISMKLPRARCADW